MEWKVKYSIYCSFGGMLVILGILIIFPIIMGWMKTVHWGWSIPLFIEAVFLFQANTQSSKQTKERD